MKRAKAWVDKKLREGVHPEELYRCVGYFSNAKKEKKMKEKNLTSSGYDKRYDFLYNAFCYLEKLTGRK